MPLTPADLDAIARLVDERLDRRVAPVEKRVAKASGQYRELGPALTRKISDSQHDIEDRSMGFEKLMLDSMAMQSERIEAVARSIPPAATAAVGAEAAAVAGAHASIDSKTNSAAAKKWAQWGPVIVLVVQGAALGIYRAILAIIEAGAGHG